MSVQKAGQILTEQQFDGNSELVTLYGNYKTYIAEQEKLFKKTSSWDLYNKGKAAYEEATIRYNEADSLFRCSKKQEYKAKTKYYKLLADFKNRHGKDYKLTTTEKTAIASESGYTNDLRKSVRDNEQIADHFLDMRALAVDTQRRGLYYNV